MSENRQPEGNRVFCHQCEHEWNRSEGGLTCPQCGGEFVEIRHAPTPPPVPQHPFRDFSPWGVPDPDEGDIRTYTFGGGRGRIAFTSRTYNSMNGGFGGNASRSQLDPAYPGFTPFGLPQHPAFAHGGYAVDDRFGRQQPMNAQPANLQDLFSMVFQTMSNPHYQYQQAGVLPPGHPFAVLSQVGPPRGRPGDAAWSQEQFDQIMTQLMEQNHVSTAPPPASDRAISELPKKIVTKDMLDEDGKAECSICMDSAELNDEVTNLPCKHWFHRDCVVAWLKEHDTCPHCRAPITSPADNPEPTTPARPEASRRRSSRRHSSMASPPPPPPDSTRPNRPTSLDSPPTTRDVRQNSNARRDSEYDRSRINRTTTQQSQASGGNTAPHNNDDDGVDVGQALSDAASWIRNRLPFGR